MPLTHVVLDGDRYSLAEARDIVATRDPSLRYTPELFESMIATRQERDYISTTVLTGKCLRQKALEHEVDYTLDMDAMWAAFRGTMFHGQLEKHIQEGAFEEARFFTNRFMDELGQPLSGSPDVVTLSGIEYDYKFTKEVPRWNKPWGDHVEQVNINRWLVDHADKVEWRGWRFETGKEPVVFDNDSVGIIPMEIREPKDFRPRDWQDLILVYMDDKGVKPLRATRSIDVPKVSGEGTKKALVSDIWSDEKVEELLDTRFPEAVEALVEGVVPPAPDGWEHQSHILCQYCPVRHACAALESEGR